MKSAIFQQKNVHCRERNLTLMSTSYLPRSSPIRSGRRSPFDHPKCQEHAILPLLLLPSPSLSLPFLLFSFFLTSQFLGKNAKLVIMMSIFDPTRGSYSLGRVLLRRNTLYAFLTGREHLENLGLTTFNMVDRGSLAMAVTVCLKAATEPCGCGSAGKIRGGGAPASRVGDGDPCAQGGPGQEEPGNSAGTFSIGQSCVHGRQGVTTKHATETNIAGMLQTEPIDQLDGAALLSGALQDASRGAEPYVVETQSLSAKSDNDTSLALNIITDHCPELAKKQLHTMMVFESCLLCLFLCLVMFPEQAH